MKTEIKTLEEMRNDNILTDDYAVNLEVGEFTGRLVMLAECSKTGTLRAFFQFDDGRKVFALLQFFNRYLNIFSVSPGDRVKLFYHKIPNGVYPYKIERIE